MQLEEREEERGRPWRLSGKESACRCRRQGFDPWSGKIPYAAGQLSPCTTTISLFSRAWESQLPKTSHPSTQAPQQGKSSQWEASSPQRESSPWLLQREKSLHSTEDPAKSKKETKERREEGYFWINCEVLDLQGNSLPTSSIKKGPPSLLSCYLPPTPIGSLPKSNAMDLFSILFLPRGIPV